MNTIGRKRKYKYALGRDRIYSIWRNMIKRCSDDNRLDYKYYGGRGIKVCDKWKDFNTFCEDLLQNYSSELTLDRINVNGDYEPNNCRWVPMSTQCRNKRSNIKNDIGEIASDASRRLNGNRSLVFRRIRVYGWTVEEAYNKPIYRKGDNIQRFTKECEMCKVSLQPTNKYNNDKRRRCVNCRNKKPVDNLLEV